MPFISPSMKKARLVKKAIALADHNASPEKSPGVVWSSVVKGY